MERASWLQVKVFFMDSSLQIRKIGFQEIGLIRPLFQQVFGTDLSESMLAWKYSQGRGESYGAFAGDVLLAHCGIFYREVLAEGQRCRIGQLVDLMALPGRYGGLSRKSSPFALLIKVVLAELPREDNQDGLAFGFPSDRAMRLGEHLGLFAAIDQIRQLNFAPLRRSWYSDCCATVKPAGNDFSEIVNRLWRQMAEVLGSDLLGIRDAAYLAQRYFQHPLNHYDCHLVTSRWLRHPVGILVTRTSGGQCELMDIVAPPKRIPRLLQAMRQHLSTMGAHAMSLWLTEHHARGLEGLALSCEKTEFRIMANPFSSGGWPERFSHRWWLTSGDTDYR